jgi:hypothetical protein
MFVNRFLKSFRKKHPSSIPSSDVFLIDDTVLIGLLKMYVAGEKSLVPPKKK